MSTGGIREKISELVGDEKRRSFSKRFRMKLILSFAMTCSIILVLAFLLFYGEAKELLLKRSVEDTTRQLEQVETFVRNMESEAMHITQLLMLDYNAGKLLNGLCRDETETVKTAQEILDQIQEVLNNYTYVDSVFYYGYNGVVIGEGLNYRRYVLDGRNNPNFPGSWFYDSEIYQEVVAAKEPYLWKGDLESREFHFYSIEKSENYLSLLFRMNLLQDKPIVMVVNFEEEYLSQLYDDEDIGAYHRRYIVDGDGRIISAVDKTQIGSQSAYEMLDTDGEDSYLTAENGDGEKVQVVFRALEGMNWGIVDEISIAWLERDVAVLQKYLYIILAVSLTVSLLVAQFWIRRITDPLMKLTEKMRETEDGRLGQTLDEDTVRELGVVGRQYNRMSESIVTLIEENRHIEEEKRYYEIETLWQQINPHFIYNTLNTIKWMSILSKTDNITACVEAFGNLLTPIFRQSKEEYSLREEFSYIRNYVTVMNYRYGNLLQLDINCPECYMDNRILRLLLQPILENAILHGMRGDGIPLHLSVKAAGDEENLFLTVEDDGRGMQRENLTVLRKGMADITAITPEEKEKIGRAGIGTSNICKRIRLLYGKEYGVCIESKPGQGTKVQIHLPMRKMDLC